MDKASVVFEKMAFRGVGSMVGKGVIPIIGGPVGDYLVSREMQKKSQFAGIAKALKPLAKNVMKNTVKFGKGYAANVGKDFSTLAGTAGKAAKRKALVGLAGRVGLPGYIAGDMLT